MEWFKKKMRVFLFVCLLFPFYSYAAKISLSISGKIEDHSGQRNNLRDFIFKHII